MILVKQENAPIVCTWNNPLLDVSACQEQDTSPFMPRACPSSVSGALAVPAEMGAGSASKEAAHC